MNLISKQNHFHWSQFQRGIVPWDEFCWTMHELSDAAPRSILDIGADLTGLAFLRYASQNALCRALLAVPRRSGLLTKLTHQSRVMGLEPASIVPCAGKPDRITSLPDQDRHDFVRILHYDTYPISERTRFLRLLLSRVSSAASLIIRGVYRADEEQLRSDFESHSDFEWSRPFAHVVQLRLRPALAVARATKTVSQPSTLSADREISSASLDDSADARHTGTPNMPGI